MIYITGDTHRDFDRIEEFCAYAHTTVDDVLVILGDVGINFLGDPYDTELKQQLIDLPITLLCVHGNHEMRPEGISSYEENEWRGGDVYWEPEFTNLLFAKDGEVYDLEGVRSLVIGGAYSADKHMRIPYENWWPDEQPSDEIMDRVEARLEAENWQVDVVLSHTCPYKHIPHHSFLPYIPQESVDKTTERWLDAIEDRLIFSLWYSGHYHVNEWSPNGSLRFLFDDCIELYI